MRTTPHWKRPFSSHLPNILRCTLSLCAAVFLLSGCAAGVKSSADIRQYALEYSSPAFKDMARVNESLRVEPFSIVRNYNTTSMVYRSKPYLYGDDAYHRWKVKPSAMVSDMLLRDMRNAGLFRGVFSDSDRENSGYALSGVIEELYELEDPVGSRAVLAMHVTLLHTDRKKTNGRTVFQKSYRSVQVMEKKDAESLARAMSHALEGLSKEIILDTYSAIRRNGDDPKGEPSLHGLSVK